MAERPILFSGPMVRAILEGRKTQTRRVLTPQPAQNSAGLWCASGPGFDYQVSSDQLAIAHPVRFENDDLLYVREAWRTPESLDHLSPNQIQEQILDLGYRGVWCPRVTEADNLAHQWSEEDGFREDEPCGRLRQGMHMPRWASRLTLKVTDVRVQRLQEISEEDALAEGICKWVEESDHTPWGNGSDLDRHLLVSVTYGSAVKAFNHLWDSLNEKRGFGWDTNPWVVAITFEVHHCNVDSFNDAVAA